MRAKDFLQQLQKIDIVINQLENEKRGLKKRLKNISTLDLAEIAEIHTRTSMLAAETDRLIDEYNTKKHDILELIHTLNNPVHITLLHEYYIEGKHLYVIAREMNYSSDHIRRMHGQALKELENLMKKPRCDGK